MKIGYIRVSSLSQTLDVQMEILTKEGCEEIYQEKKTGLKTLPELGNAIKSLRQGDTLYVWAFDRLGRSMFEVISNAKIIHDKGGNIYSHIQKVDTSTEMGRFMFYCFVMFAEMEANLRKERTMAGIAYARKQGRHLGRPKGMTKKTLSKSKLVKQMYLSKEPYYSVKQIADALEISKKTIYRCLEHEGVELRGGLEN